jgi:hypothetical protein
MMQCPARCSARNWHPEHTEPPDGRGIELPARIGKNQDRRPGLQIVTGAGSYAAHKLSGISFISRHSLGNEDGSADADVGAKNARIETGNIVGLQCRSSP